MADINTRIGIEVDIQGIDNSIRSTQRLLYFMNSIRLAAVDFQRLMKEPSLENLFWTALNLSYVWTNLISTIKQANKLAAGGGALDFLGLGGYGGGGRGAGNLAKELAERGMMTSGYVKPSMLSRAISAMAGMSLWGWAALGVAAAVGTAIVWDVYQRNNHAEFERRQREIARSQGIEY